MPVSTDQEAVRLDPTTFGEASSHALVRTAQKQQKLVVKCRTKELVKGEMACRRDKSVVSTALLG